MILGFLNSREFLQLSIPDGLTSNNLFWKLKFKTVGVFGLWVDSLVEASSFKLSFGIIIFNSFLLCSLLSSNDSSFISLIERYFWCLINSGFISFGWSDLFDGLLFWFPKKSSGNNFFEICLELY